MKRVKIIFNCAANSIKKKFFKSQKTAISQDCEKLLKSVKETTSFQEKELTEEVANQYIITTRWQTV